MADLNRSNDPNGKRNSDAGIPQRTVLLWIGVFSMVLVFFLIKQNTEQQPKTFEYWSQLQEQLDKARQAEVKAGRTFDEGAFIEKQRKAEIRGVSSL